ncbi:hypothetical protein [Calothrix rhizosoleniae]|uniref:hypothetical protein n=1 Tax=Calothrix rhizosoleniae TaxID=888997 RepID=UPI000B4A1600|nr:hypothetical protein [Calothrix rhizosoleniae]
MAQDLFTTGEAAEQTGIPEGTIRSWMSRRPGAFTIDVDIIVEKSGRKMWTEAGLATLRQQRGTADESPGASYLDDILEPLLDAGSKQLAHYYFQQLPLRTLRRIQLMMANPSDEERQIVQQAVDQAINQGTTALLPQYVRLEPDGD